MCATETLLIPAVEDWAKEILQWLHVNFPTLDTQLYLHTHTCMCTHHTGASINLQTYSLYMHTDIFIVHALCSVESLEPAFNCDLQLVDYLQVCTTVYILAVLLHVQQ